MRKINLFFIFVLFLFGASVSLVKAVGQNSATGAVSLGFNELILTAGGQKQVISKDQFNNFFLIEPTLKIGSGKKSEIENIKYCPGSPVLCRMLSSLNQMIFLKKETAFSTSQQNIESFISNIADNMDKDPVNAKFKMEADGTISFTPDEKGMQLDVPKSIQLLSEILTSNEPFEDSKEVALPFNVSDPEIKSSDVNSMGINTLIGEGTSNFRGSPKNRIFNINVATEKFNGVLIKPGEEFSFVGTLGPVDGEHGYAPELVIKQDRTEPEFGGGICQVSTTAFRAAINSGLKITARRNHAYPVAYYNPQGMDATVYIPKPDLKFINNTPSNILIQTKIEGTQLTFQFFGTSDGRKTEVIGPKILERKPDGSMKTTFTQKVSDKDGNSIINDVFNSNYDSPSKYPHPGDQKLTSKPAGWSSKEWKKYKQTNGI
jgi:vancomycin resistance protein YoaR